MIHCECPDCGRSIKAKDDFAGKKVKCPGCGTILKLPAPLIETTPVKEVIARPAPVQAKQPESVLLFQAKAPEVEYAPPPAHPPSAPIQQVIVNTYQQKKESSNSIGICSMVIGVLSIVICWMPFISWIIAATGLLLGIIGIGLSFSRRGQGIGYSIGGSILSSTCLLAWFIFFVIADGVSKDMKQAQEKRAGNISSPKDKTPVTNSIVSPVTSPPVVDEEKAKWHSPGETITLDKVGLKITSVTIGIVKIKPGFGDVQESNEPQLLIKLEISNLDKNKKLEYTSYASSRASLRDVKAVLRDEHENRYRMINFGFGSHVEGTLKDTDSIYPGKTALDGLVFEVPIDTANELQLTLSGEAFGQDKDVQFKIPRSFIGN